MAWTKIGLYVSLGLTAVCVFGYLGETMLGGGGGGTGIDPDAPVYMLCANPSCNAEVEMTQKEFMDLASDMDPMGMPMMMGPMAYNCPECNKKSLYRATKCPECDKIFVENYQAVDDYPDRCPDCGYSELEDKYGN